MFPIIPFLCVAALVGGGGGLFWYESQSDADKERADKLTADLALKLFGKAVTNLTRDQADVVASMVRKQIGA